MNDTAEPKQIHSPLGFKIIGAFKLASALLLVAAGIGIFKLLDRDLASTLTSVLTQFRLDPDNRLLHGVIAKVAGIDHKTLKTLGVGTFVYAFLHVVEGVGLLLDRSWASFMTIFITSSLLPVEIYELVLKVDALRVAAISVNVAIVIYLVIKTRQELKARRMASSAPTPADVRPASPSPGV